MTATVFLKNGLSFMPTAEAALDLHETLPVGNYIVKQNPMNQQLYFEQVDSFPEQGKLYGNTTRHASRIMNTFNDRTPSTGVMLTGEKGSGKTLLAKLLSKNGATLGYPTIVINSPWCGDQFNQLIQSLTQPAIIVFDEFEKVYDSNQQESILTLLDGVFPCKKLFILTCNDKWRVDQHMRNRPGRIYYMIEFKGLDSKFVQEYCEDNLNNKENIDSVCKVGMLFAEFNFDMLKAIVAEMNRYDEDVHSAIEILNAKPQSDSGGKYNVSLKVDGKAIPLTQLSPEVLNGTPIGRDSITIEVYPPRGGDEDSNENDEVPHVFRANDLKTIDTVTGSFTFVNADGNQLILKRQMTQSYDFTNVF